MVKWLRDKRWNDYPIVVAQDDGKIEILDDEQLAAWDKYGVEQRGRPFPRNKRGGWRFPSKWPPGYDPPARIDPPIIPMLRSV